MTSCACCQSPAAFNLAIFRTSDRLKLFVPYCGPCYAHASAVRTLRLACTLASGLLGLTAAATLPLLWPFVPAPVYVCSTLVAGLIPLVASGFAMRRLPGSGHTAIGQAVWWLKNGELCCTSAGYASEIGRQSEQHVRATQEQPPAWVGSMAAGFLATFASLPAIWWIHHPLVRVVNLTDFGFAVLIDGHPSGYLEPTSAEDARAGAELRVPSGRRELLVLRPEGQVVARSAVTVRGGQDYLYAPGSAGYCFWLETVTYGRNAVPQALIVPLVGSTRFWALPGHVDTWFGRNPDPPERDHRSSGGRLTALRQSRCSDAPEEAIGTNGDGHQ